MSESTPRPDDPSVVGSAGHRGLALLPLIVACAFFMEALDANIIVTALPQIAMSFHVPPERASVGITAYLLAVAACIPASGWLTERLGGRTLFCAAIGLFTVASMACGAAPNFPFFIAARALQGVAAAMMSPVGRLVVLRNTRQSDLMGALSTLVWPALFGPVVGPPLGGWITQTLSWRWTFFINLPIGLLGMALVILFVPKSTTEKRSPFDLRGFALMGASLALLVYGLDAAGRASGADLQRLGLGVGMVLAAVAVGMLALRHIGRSPHPLLELTPLRVRTFFVGAISGGTLSRAAIGATPFLLPLMFQVCLGYSPAASGGLLMVYMGGNLAMKAVTNPILRRFGFRQALIVNGLVASVAIALCAAISAHMAWPLTFAILLLAGASRSMQFTAITMVGFADLNDADRPAASTLFSLAQQIGMSLGIAVGALVLSLSQIFRGVSSLGLLDVRLGLLIAAAFSALATISYRSLAPDAGATISGHKMA